MYPKQQQSNEKNAASQPQPSAGSSYVNGPPPPAYSKEVEASAPPQGYMQYSMGQPHVFNQAMQPYSGSMQYGYPQPPNMYYANGSHPMHMSAQQAMAHGMYLAQPQFQAGPPPGYGGGPQYPTGYCPPPPYQSPIHVQHQQSVYHPGTAVPVATFDAGARFGGKGGGSMTIPPPPPGYKPTAAQIVAMSGQAVLAQQRAQSFFTGGKGAGATFW